MQVSTSLAAIHFPRKYSPALQRWPSPAHLESSPQYSLDFENLMEKYAT
jgi:hypothetical protein